MVYIVFTRDIKGDRFSVTYLNVSRVRALERFQEATESRVRITKKPGKVYLVGFDATKERDETVSGDTPSTHKGPITGGNSVIAQKLAGIKEVGEVKLDHIEYIISNIDSADYVASFEPKTPHFKKTTQVLDKQLFKCDRCDKLFNSLQKTAYGEQLCSSCWEDYIHEEDIATLEENTLYPGFVEYAIAMLSGNYDLIDFTESELTEIREAWEYYNNSMRVLLGLSTTTPEPSTTEQEQTPESSTTE
jgi:hypothetical protein